MSRFFERRRREQELDEEIHSHFRMAVEERVARGESHNEAELAVRREFGNLGQVKEVTRSMWGGIWLDRLVLDLRFGLRGLRRAPGFSVMAIATLALGIGATTAIFSLFDAILLAPLPYPEPEQLVQIWERSPRDGSKSPVSGANAAEWPQTAHSFSAIGAYRTGRSVTLTGDGAPQLLIVADTHPSVADVLGVEPLLGSNFVARDATGDGRLALLRHSTWVQHFGADPAVLGQSVTLDDRPVTVVGVMPPGFAFPGALPGERVDLWMPLTVGSLGLDATDRSSRTLLVVGRLRDGVTLETAMAELAALGTNREADHPETAGWGVELVPLHEDLTGEVRLLLTLVLAGVGVVLFVACANLANLLLARAVGRQREIAVRGALGAGRLRIVRQLVTESLLLGVLGGSCALGAAPLLLRAFVALAPSDTPLIERAAIDERAFFFGGLLSFASVLLFGLAPALHQTQVAARNDLRSGRSAAQAGHARLRASLLVAQVALAVVLLIGAGLLVRTFSALNAVDLGFDDEDLVTMAVMLPIPRYPTVGQQSQFFDQLLERIRAIPGVSSASGSSGSPGQPGRMGFPFVIDGRPASTPSGREDAEDFRIVTADYFDVIRQPLVQGRVFTSQDRADSPAVVVVNQAFARKHWPDADPIGQRIALPHYQERNAWQEVVGVVADARLEGPNAEPIPRLYVPYSQHDQIWQSWLTLIARLEPGADEASANRAMTAALSELDPNLPPRGLATVEGTYRRLTAGNTFAMTLAVAFGLSALLLCVLGLYGLISYSVAAQRRDISLRMALGADLTRIAGSVVRSSLELAALGALGGALAALAASRAIEGMLFGVSPLDAATYTAIVAMVLLVALAAAGIPAWRATRINPVSALSAD